MKIQSLLRFLITAVVFIIALLLGHALWRHYLYAPWTRDGRVRAEVVRIAPDVTGLVTQVPVADNQAVHKGDVLLTIDEERYRFAVEQAEANLAAAQASASAAGASIKAAMAATAARKTEFDMRQEQAVRRQQLGDVIAQESRNDATSAAAAAHAGFQQAQAGASQARAARGQALAAVQQAQAALDTARLNLSRAVVRAPVDGYVTNLDVRFARRVLAVGCCLRLSGSGLDFIQMRIGFECLVDQRRELRIAESAPPILLRPGCGTERCAGQAAFNFQALRIGQLAGGTQITAAGAGNQRQRDSQIQCGCVTALHRAAPA